MQQLTQTRTVSLIIRNHLSWEPVDSEGKSVTKLPGDDLELLLKCHKSGINVRITTPDWETTLPPSVHSGSLSFGGHDSSENNRERWDMTPDEIHSNL